MNWVLQSDLKFKRRTLDFPFQEDEAYVLSPLYSSH